MNIGIANNIGNISSQLPIGTNPPDNQAEKKTAQGISAVRLHQMYNSSVTVRNEGEFPDINSRSISGENISKADSSEKPIKLNDSTSETTTLAISVIPPEQVSPLLALPNELLAKIAEYLPFTDFRSLDLTCRRLNTLFNTEERLKILVAQYYGSAAEAYRNIINKWDIPAVPTRQIYDSLALLALRRYQSNLYLASRGINSGQTCQLTLEQRFVTVHCVTLLANGWLASGYNDQTIKVWDLGKPEGHQCVMRLNGHTYEVRTVMQLADGRLVSCTGDVTDTTVRVWDLNKPDGQQCVATLAGGIAVFNVTQLSDGRLACCCADGTIKIWDLSQPSGQPSVLTLNGHTSWVVSVTQLPDDRLASCSADGTIKVWDLSKPHGQQCVVTLNGHTKSVQAVTVLANGQLASCSDDHTIKVWDLDEPDEQQCVITLNGHTDWVQSVMQLPDGRLVSCSNDETIKVWDLGKPVGQQCVATLQGHTGWVNSVVLLPDGRLVSYTSDKKIKVWDLSKPAGQECVVTLHGHTGKVNSVISLPGGLLASCSMDGTIKVWDLNKPDRWAVMDRIHRIKEETSLINKYTGRLG